MRMFSEPESWLGLRSERVVAVEFGRPAERRASPPRQAAGDTPDFSWAHVRSMLRRKLTVLLGR